MRQAFESLNLPPDASIDEVRLAFRRIAMECHPDRAPGDPTRHARFQQARKAYEDIHKQEGIDAIRRIIRAQGGHNRPPCQEFANKEQGAAQETSGEQPARHVWVKQATSLTPAAKNAGAPPKTIEAYRRIQRIHKEDCTPGQLFSDFA